MTKAEKKELIVALCAYLPYSLKFKGCKYTDEGDLIDTDITLESIDINGVITFKECSEAEHDIDRFKPYLRSMSTMTDDEKEKWISLRMQVVDYVIGYDAVVDFYNEHHLDYRHLIDDELAIEAPEDMYI